MFIFKITIHNTDDTVCNGKFVLKQTTGAFSLVSDFQTALYM